MLWVLLSVLSSRNHSNTLLFQMGVEKRVPSEQFAAEFCSRYLPQLVVSIMILATSEEVEESVPPIALRHVQILGAIVKSPYFGKYMMSKSRVASAGKELPRILAGLTCRLCRDFETNWIAGTDNGVGNFFVRSLVPIFASIIVTFPPRAGLPTLDDGIADDLRIDLLETMGRWKTLRPICEVESQNIDYVACLVKLGGVMKGRKERRNAARGWDGCGIPSCQVTSSLKVCGRYVLSLPLITATAFDFESCH
jgi:hypothetical protein